MNSTKRLMAEQSHQFNILLTNAIREAGVTPETLAEHGIPLESAVRCLEEMNNGKGFVCPPLPPESRYTSHGWNLAVKKTLYALSDFDEKTALEQAVELARSALNTRKASRINTP